MCLGLRPSLVWCGLRCSILMRLLVPLVGISVRSVLGKLIVSLR